MPFGFKFLHRLLEDVHTPHYFNEIALVGAAADKPAGANAKDNMLYYETDTGLWKRYRTALSEWVIVTSLAQIMGYDYVATLSKNVGIDPDTKAILIKSQVTGAPPETYVLKAGDTMTGLLTLSGAPTVDLHAATKKYVDDQAPGAFDNYKCRAYLSVNQVIDKETWTKINLDKTSYDPYGCFESANKGIRIKAAGDYLVIDEVWYDYGIGAGSVCSVELRKNGTTINAKDEMCGPITNGKDIQPIGADIYPLAVNDLLTLWTKYYVGDATATIQGFDDAVHNYITVIRMP